MVKSAGGIPVFADLKFPNTEIDINEIKKNIKKNCWRNIHSISWI